MMSFEALVQQVYRGDLEAVREGARGHDLSRRDAHGRTLLHHAAATANTALCRWLLTQPVDADARDDQRQSAADRVSRGDPSCDPEEVQAWRDLRQELQEAAQEARRTTTTVGFPAGLSEDGVREWVLRRFGALARQGGGERTITCTSATRLGEGWRFEGTVHSAYAGTNPAHDPPWEQAGAISLSLDVSGWPALS